MKPRPYIYILIFVCIILNACHARYLVGVQELQYHEKPKILYIEMETGDILEYKVHEIILTKQTDSELHLYLKDSSNVFLNTVDIREIKIKEYQADRTIGLTVGIITAGLLTAIIWGLSTVPWY